MTIISIANTFKKSNKLQKVDEIYNKTVFERSFKCFEQLFYFFNNLCFLVKFVSLQLLSPFATPRMFYIIFCKTYFSTLAYNLYKCLKLKLCVSTVAGLPKNLEFDNLG